MSATADEPTMNLVRFRDPGGREAFAIVEDGSLYVVEEPIWEGLRPTGEEIALAAATLLPPTVPKLMIGIGLNYRSHLGNRPVPDPPALFVLASPSLAGPGDDIVLPPGARRVVPEGEVVVVIGKSLSRASRAEAEDAILGYTAGNDVTARNWLKSPGDWWRAKGSDSFSICGPQIVVGLGSTPISVSTRVNGAVVQIGTTADLVLGPVEVVQYVSSFVSLGPGDLVFTGSPGVVAPLETGDVVEVEATGTGTLRNTVVMGGAPRVS